MADGQRPVVVPDEPRGNSEPAYSEDGVDLTLIRWMLSLTPAQRLEVLEQYAEDILAVRSLNGAG